ncbi:hypothetical protein ACVWXE_002534 [Thermostichus sp. MS-CIW-41]|jgi:hypothetical protein
MGTAVVKGQPDTASAVLEPRARILCLWAGEYGDILPALLLWTERGPPFPSAGRSPYLAVGHSCPTPLVWVYNPRQNDWTSGFPSPASLATASSQNKSNPRERCIGRQDGLLHPGTPVHRPRARCYPLVDFRQSVVVYVPANLQPRQQQGLRPADASGLLGGIWINPVLVGYTSISRFCYRFRSGVWRGSLYPGAYPAGRAQD